MPGLVLTIFSFIKNCCSYVIYLFYRLIHYFYVYKCFAVLWDCLSTCFPQRTKEDTNALKLIYC